MQTAARNGDLKELLSEDRPLTAGYKAPLPVQTLMNPDGSPGFWVLRDVESMMMHPHISMCMDIYRSGIYGAEFEAEVDDPDTGQFIQSQVEKFWDVGMPAVQNSYDYGWLGAENMYDDADGILKWDNLIDFHARDTFVLSQDHEFVGVRVKRVPERGDVDLWTNTEDIPGKAFWYAHRPRFNQWYGRTQYAGAWRPWKRLASPDGAEYVVDGAMYRFGVAGPVFRYPPEAYKKGANQQPSTPEFAAARDMANQFIEQAKAGAGLALPSTKWTKEQGGGDKWGLDWPQHTLNPDGILAYIKYLKDEMAYGIGTPPEVLQASDVGSGYSGRAIPLEAFLLMQQVNADRILAAFVKQILRPLVRWNFGPQKWNIRVKSLLKMRDPQQNQPAGMPGQMPGQDQQLGGAMAGMPGQQGGAMPPQSTDSRSTLVPYQGPRGGHGQRNPVTGAVYYGSLNDLTARIAAKARLALNERSQLGMPGMKLLKVALGEEQMGLKAYRQLLTEVAESLKARGIAA